MIRPFSTGCLLLLVLLLLSGCDDSNEAAVSTTLAPVTTHAAPPATTPVIDATTATTAAPTSTTLSPDQSTSDPEPEADQVSMEASEVLVPHAWNPILAETKARPAPAPATCPSLSIPGAEDRAGSPVFPYEAGTHGPAQAVFDQHAGQVIYLDGTRTWAFDVCTNTWSRLQDHGEWKPAGWLGAPVYDIDSDTTVSFGWVRAVFDMETGSWTEHGYPNGLDGISAAAYDPGSGLIVATSWEDRVLRAYDVDTDTWTEVGTIPIPGEWGNPPVYVLGYLPALDRLVVTAHRQQGATLLVDPRTGTTSVLSSPSPGWPFVHGGAVWQTADSVIVDIARLDFSLCEFNEQSLTWDTCHALPDEATDVDSGTGGSGQSTPFEVNTIVEDTINNRLLFLDIRDFRAPDSWALDQDTNQWTHIPFATTD